MFDLGVTNEKSHKTLIIIFSTMIKMATALTVAVVVVMLLMSVICLLIITVATIIIAAAVAGIAPT